MGICYSSDKYDDRWDPFFGPPVLKGFAGGSPGWRSVDGKRREVVPTRVAVGPPPAASHSPATAFPPSESPHGRHAVEHDTANNVLPATSPPLHELTVVITRAEGQSWGLDFQREGRLTAVSDAHEHAGLLRGDVVTGVNGSPVADGQALARALKATAATTATLSCTRRREPDTAPVEMHAVNTTSHPNAVPLAPERESSVVVQREPGQPWGLEFPREAARITAVAAAHRKAGLHPGDTVTAVNGTPVASGEELAVALKATATTATLSTRRSAVAVDVRAVEPRAVPSHDTDARLESHARQATLEGLPSRQGTAVAAATSSEFDVSDGKGGHAPFGQRPADDGTENVWA